MATEQTLLTLDDIKAIIRAQGFTPSISKYISSKGHSAQTVKISAYRITGYIAKRQAQKKHRYLGRLEVVSQMSEEALKALITSKFEEGQRP